METQGNKRVMSFEEFVDAGHGSDMDQMGMGQEPGMMQSEPAMGNQAEIGSGIDLQKEPESDSGMDIAMLDEPEAQTATEEPSTDNTTQEEPTVEPDVEESIGSWFSN